jgi:hypothetical protein
MTNHAKSQGSRRHNAGGKKAGEARAVLAAVSLLGVSLGVAAAAPADGSIAAATRPPAPDAVNKLPERDQSNLMSSPDQLEGQKTRKIAVSANYSKIQFQYKDQPKKKAQNPRIKAGPGTPSGGLSTGKPPGTQTLQSNKSKIGTQNLRSDQFKVPTLQSDQVKQQLQSNQLKSTGPSTTAPAIKWDMKQNKAF